jgi:hypothetical protein
MSDLMRDQSKLAVHFDFTPCALTAALPPLTAKAYFEVLRKQWVTFLSGRYLAGYPPIHRPLKDIGGYL